MLLQEAASHTTRPLLEPQGLGGRILRASPPAAGPPVSSDWLTGIREAQTWSNGLKSKETWGAMLYAYGAFNPGILEAWGFHF